MGLGSASSLQVFLFPPEAEQGLFFFFALLLAMTKDGIGHGLGELLLSTLQFATFEKTPDIDPNYTWGKVVKLGAKLFIPLQAALMALAIRNRFRR